MGRLMEEAHATGLRRPNLYLVGFMGTGKSSVGRAVAELLGMDFMDSDSAIEGRAGRRVREIFEQEGEAAFRTMEREFVETGHPAQGCVVACGGGLVLGSGIPERLRERGVVVCLFATAETVYQRTRNGARPLLNVADPQARIAELLAQREPVYRACGPGVATDRRPLRDVAEHVVRVYGREVRERFPQSAAASGD